MAFTPYTTAAEYFGQKPSWIPDAIDQARIQAYQAYEEMYWNAPDTFKISLRGTNNLPIYIPSARTIVDTTARYVGADFNVLVTGPSTDAEDIAGAQLALKDFMKRERFRSRFSGAKKYGLIQGDSIWHLTADPNKPVGSRLRVVALDPSVYFPIQAPDDVDKTIAIHLAHTATVEEEEVVRRVTYRKTDSGGITSEEALYSTENWYPLDAPPLQVIRPITPLPDIITSFPVYHTKNSDQPGDPFGSSELRGLERVMAGINQTVSDEDLALALMGIGMWATDASHPVDPKTGERVAWQMGPGRVVHHDGSKFDKIAGTGSLAEGYGEHYNRLWESIFQASSTPDVAVGSVDVSIAQSGIALQLQLSPMLSKADAKNTLIKDSHDQMFYDIIHQWMPAYEETTFSTELDVECTMGSGVPVNREERFTELNDMLDRGVITTEYYRSEAAKLGYQFPEGIGALADAEYEKRNAMTDGFADRVDQEIGASGGGTTES